MLSSDGRQKCRAVLAARCVINVAVYDCELPYFSTDIRRGNLSSNRQNPTDRVTFPYTAIGLPTFLELADRLFLT